LAFRSHRPLASGSISSGSSRPEAPGPRILEWRPTPARNGTKLSSGHGCGATTLHWTRRADYRRLPLRIPGVSPKPATRRPRAEPLQCGVNFGDIVAAEVANTIGGLSVSDLKQHVRYVGNNPGRIDHGTDRSTPASLRNRLKRDLADMERKECRRDFTAAPRNARGKSLPGQ